MGDVESGRRKLMDGDDDIGMTLSEIGMGVSFDMEGVDGGCHKSLNEAEDEELEIPELSKSLTPRTIPFRSASFSQVDICDGKYVRNPRSAITLKPTAFCLNNVSQKGISSNNYGYSASTLPRHGDKSSIKCPSTNDIINDSTDTTNISTNSNIITSNTNLLSLPPQSIISQLNKENQKLQMEQAREQEQHQQQNQGKQQEITEIQEDQQTNSEVSAQNYENNETNYENNLTMTAIEPNLSQVDDINNKSEINSENNETLNPEILTQNMEFYEQNNRFNNNANNNANSVFDNNGQSEENSTLVQFYLGPEPEDASKECTMDIIDPALLQKDVEENDDNLDDNKVPKDCDSNIQTGNDNLMKTNSCEQVENTNISYTDENNSNMTNNNNNNNTANMSSDLDGNTSSSTKNSDENINAMISDDNNRINDQSESNNNNNNTTNETERDGGLKEELGSENVENILPTPTELEIISNSLGLGELDDKNPLLRQGSGQSDGSDEIPPLITSSSANSSSDLQCSSPPLPDNLNKSNINTNTNNNNNNNGTTTIRHPLSIFHSRGQSESTILGCSSSGLPSLNYGSATSVSPNKKEISRANSVNCSVGIGGGGNDGSGSSSAGVRPLPPRRYNKRPLRGPYGLMLEAEMLKNELIPARSLRDYDNSDFCRESKSSSPNRTLPSLHSSLSHVDPEPSRTAAVLSSSTDNCSVWASMDDLHSVSSQSKTLNPRSRKIGSTAQNAQFPGESPATTLVAFHQRTASSPSQLLYSTSSDRPASSSTQGRNLARGHVLAEVVETEKSYVDSLRILVKKYMEPLKTLDIVDAGLVDEIFFQIPRILWHHERLLEALQRRFQVDDTQSVGDVLLEFFKVQPDYHTGENSLLKSYSLFVNNWKNAKALLKMAVATIPFARFLEDNARQHKGKLTLDSLLIMPVQRIPRYELLVKELLKHTPRDHEDYSRLNLVLENIKQFALHIDCASVDPNDNREIEFEGWPNSNLFHLVRQDIVTLCTSSNVKKERALFLFQDSVVIASIKRKSTMRKPSSSTSHNLGNSFDGCKFKLIRSVPLTDIHLLNEDPDVSSMIGGNISSVTAINKTTPKSGGGSSLTSHEETDDLKIIHKMVELASQLKCSHAGLDETLKELASGLKHHYDNGDAIDVEIKPSDNSGDSPELLKILFGSTEKKIQWVDCFQETLSKFIRYGFGKDPQVQFLQALPIRKTRAGLQLSCAAPVSLHNKVASSSYTDLWIANSDGFVGQICILTLQPEPAITSCNGVCNSRITCIISVPPPSSPQSPKPLHPALPPHPAQEDQHPHPHLHSLGYESEDDSHRNRPGYKSSEGGKCWSVWLGTEDGGLHVYDCSDSVRVKKNRHKIQHNAPLNCIVYFDSRVFVALGNGDVAVYSRNTSGKGWSIGDPAWITIGTAINPVTKVICVNSQIWCACGSQIKVYGENGGMLELWHSIQVTVEGSNVARGISCIVCDSDHVWVAVAGTSFLKCFNVDGVCLYETNISAEVSKILAGCDDIIRQHKSACLRVTALLLAPDKTLWVGTSAGVILTVSPANHNHNYKITPLCYGHTGQVRFMTCCTDRNSFTVISGGDGYEEFRPVPSLFNTHNSSSSTSSSFGSMMSSLMGESSVDISGREDSTNHLLMWKVQKLPS